jgi:hypothetical protein
MLRHIHLLHHRLPFGHLIPFLNSLPPIFSSSSLLMSTSLYGGIGGRHHSPTINSPLELDDNHFYSRHSVGREIRKNSASNRPSPLASGGYSKSAEYSPPQTPKAKIIREKSPLNLNELKPKEIIVEEKKEMKRSETPKIILIEDGEENGRIKSGRMTPEGTKRSASPKMAPEGTRRSASPKMAPEGTRRSASPKMAPEGTKRSASPKMAPEGTKRSASPKMAPEGTKRSASPLDTNMANLERMTAANLSRSSSRSSISPSSPNQSKCANNYILKIKLKIQRHLRIWQPTIWNAKNPSHQLINWTKRKRNYGMEEAAKKVRTNWVNLGLWIWGNIH